MALVKAGDVDAFVARPDPARPIALVFGPDAGLVSERVEALLRASVPDPKDPFAITRLNGDDLAGDPARLVDEALAIPMFGARPAIRVRAGGRNFVPALETLVAAKPRDCRVVIEAGDLKKSAPLRAFAERAPLVAALPCYADSARDIERLIDQEMRGAGLTIAPDARAALTALLGGDRRASRNELHKLSLYAHGSGAVTMEDVLAVVPDASSLAMDAVVDAAFAGQLREVETQFGKAMGAGTFAGQVIGAALRQCYQLHKARLAIEQDNVPISDAVGPQVFFKRKPVVEAALKLWTSGRLTGAMQALAATALQVRLSPALAETAGRHVLLQLARGARQAG
jgi:DNA polymerase-3 subunit delta